jgi:hypothetical protein
MKTIRIVLAAAALAAALASCGGDVTGTAGPADAGAAPQATSGAAPPTAAPTTGPDLPDAANDADAVRIVFEAYYGAVLARDWQTACALSAPETRQALIENLQAQNDVTVGSCEEAFSTIYAVPGAAEIVDEIARTAEIQDITVTGDDAAITWTAQSQGQNPTVTNNLRRVDGDWRLLDTSS